jgi:hypothetical protein
MPQIPVIGMTATGEMVGRVFRLSMAMAIALMLGVVSAASAGATDKRSTDATGAASAERVAVETAGDVPGLGEAELGRYVAEQMNATGARRWQFFADEKSDAAPEDRVEWSFTTGPSANGALRNYGFSRAMMERLIDAHHYVTVEAKLYWHGQYQSVMLGHVTIGPALPYPALTALIGKMTRLVMSYPTSQSRPPRVMAKDSATLASGALARQR